MSHLCYYDATSPRPYISSVYTASDAPTIVVMYRPKLGLKTSAISDDYAYDYRIINNQLDEWTITMSSVAGNRRGSVFVRAIRRLNGSTALRLRILTCSR